MPKAVILARGLGTRMRAADDQSALDPRQAETAASGVKAMIPVGRPFLDYVLSALADAGFEEVCLVIGPEHDTIRDHYSDVAPTRIAVSYAVQERPLGTADAVLAAEQFAGGSPFVVLNSDNYYPATALRMLVRGDAPAMVGFEREALVREGNVPRERVGRFGALEMDADGFLVRIAGDPGRARASTGGNIYASMNCWLFDSRIFEACRAVPLSSRGEFELTQAVQLGIDRLGLRIRVYLSSAAVLDLSNRTDIARVAERLSLAEVVL